MREKINTKDLVHLATHGLSGSGLVQNLQIEIVEQETEQLQNSTEKTTQEETADLQQEKTLVKMVRLQGSRP